MEYHDLKSKIDDVEDDYQVSNNLVNQADATTRIPLMLYDQDFRLEFEQFERSSRNEWSSVTAIGRRCSMLDDLHFGR